MYFVDYLWNSERALTGSSVGIKDGKVSGLTYDLVANGTAEISISQITVTEDRAEALQFLQPTLASPGYCRSQSLHRCLLNHLFNLQNQGNFPTAAPQCNA